MNLGCRCKTYINSLSERAAIELIGAFFIRIIKKAIDLLNQLDIGAQIVNAKLSYSIK